MSSYQGNQIILSEQLINIILKLHVTITLYKH